MVKKLLSLLLLVTLFVSNSLRAQDTPPKKEFRATWIATVINLDWPASGNLPVSYQKNDLIRDLDKLKAAGINAVFFQIRTEGDALYDSDIEPWSKYLTGEEGKAPDPYWDPLSFVIEEAHKRGMELHAWMNPYRAMRTIPSDFTQKVSSTKDTSLEPFEGRYFDVNASQEKFKGTVYRDSMHLSNTHPEWLFVMNDEIAIVNPGLPEVMDYITEVVMDVVNRYDVDGIHFDDYFYPYPNNHMASSSDNNALDDSTFAQYPRGFTNKSDWRRNNINMLIEMIHDSIQVEKPWVKFGISPFGIWKDGVPTGISGMNAYSTIYADAIAWLEDQTIDYITPQLYWAFTRFGTAQDYGVLANWWSDQATQNGRHTYPGHGVYRSSASTYSGTLFNANELPRQIRHNRANDNIGGSVFLRSSNITTYTSQGFADSLKNDFYKYEALQPTMEWKDSVAFDSPSNLTVTRDAVKEYIFELTWDKPSLELGSKTSETGKIDSLIKYAVYRVDAASDPDEMTEMELAQNLIAITGETTYTDDVPPSEDAYWYFVTSVTRNNVESIPTASVEAGVVTSSEVETDSPNGFKLMQNYPNPFNPTTNIRYKVPAAGQVNVSVYDLIGRKVAVLVDGNVPAGEHTVQFDASALNSGVYFYRLTSGSTSITKKMMLIK